MTKPTTLVVSGPRRESGYHQRERVVGEQSLGETYIQCTHIYIYTMTKKDFQAYKIRPVRMSDENWAGVRQRRVHSGLGWNKFISLLIQLYDNHKETTKALQEVQHQEVCESHPML